MKCLYETFSKSGGALDDRTQDAPSNLNPLRPSEIDKDCRVRERMDSRAFGPALDK